MTEFDAAFPRSPHRMPTSPRRRGPGRPGSPNRRGSLGRARGTLDLGGLVPGRIVRRARSPGRAWWSSPRTTESRPRGYPAFPSAVTGQMVANFDAGGAAINVLAEVSGATVRVADIAVDCDEPLSPRSAPTRCAAARATSRWKTR